MDSDQLTVLLGLILGASGGIFGLWWGRKQAARNRGLDERYYTISAKSFAAAWKITLGAIYFIFIVHVFVIPLSTPAALGILLFIHLAGWTFSIFYYNKTL